MIQDMPFLNYHDVQVLNPVAILRFESVGLGYSTTNEIIPEIQLDTRAFYLFKSLEISASIPEEVYNSINVPQLVNGTYLAKNFNIENSSDKSIVNLNRINYGKLGVKPLNLAFNNFQSLTASRLRILDDQRLQFSLIPPSLDFDIDSFFLMLRFEIYKTTNQDFIKYFVEQGSLATHLIKEL